MHGSTYVLHSNEIWPYQWDVVYGAEHGDDTRMVNTRNEDSKQISEQCGLFLNVEGQSPVVSENTKCLDGVNSSWTRLTSQH